IHHHTGGHGSRRKHSEEEAKMIHLHGSPPTGNQDESRRIQVDPLKGLHVRRGLQPADLDKGPPHRFPPPIRARTACSGSACRMRCSPTNIPSTPARAIRHTSSGEETPLSAITGTVSGSSGRSRSVVPRSVSKVIRSRLL